VIAHGSLQLPAASNLRHLAGGGNHILYAVYDIVHTIDIKRIFLIFIGRSKKLLQAVLDVSAIVMPDRATRRSNSRCNQPRHLAHAPRVISGSPVARLRRECKKSQCARAGRGDRFALRTRSN
jgi:hypothetical protein